MREPVIRWCANPPVSFQETTLSTKETALLDWLKVSLQKNLTRSQILARSPLDDQDTIQVLDQLIASGVLELGDEAPSIDLPPGTPRKLGRFEVDQALGRGSSGAVLLARDPAIDRVVAIKLIQTASHLSPAQREKHRERFYREASAAGQLQHPSIATVYDVGHAEDGTPFLVMELVRGTTLRDLLESRKLPRAEVFSIAKDVLEALRFAHAQGIVHRDVKPSNIMVTPDSRAKIMDFGIAHVIGSELTATQEVLGSPYYMAPEQLSKGAITPRTDLFTFGVVLYRMLTGRLPFTGDSFAATAQAILREKPVPPERIDPAIGSRLSRLVLRCLEKSPQDRFAGADDVLRELAAIESGKAESPARRVRISIALAFAAATAAFAFFRLGPSPSALAPTAPLPSTVPIPIPSPPVAPVISPVPEPQEPPAPAAAPRARRDEPRAEPVPASEPAPPEPPIVTADEAAREPPPREPTEAELFYRARMALERGELDASKAVLETLLARNPSFAGAADLFVEVTDQIWEGQLPLVIRARHRHRLGSCEGELSLASLGVRFTSPEHEWAFSREELRVAERPDPHTLLIETFEKDTLSFGKNKRYRFQLETPLDEADWARYQRLIE